MGRKIFLMPPMVKIGGFFIGALRLAMSFFVERKGDYLNRNLTAEQSFTEIAESIAIDPKTATPPDKPVIMLRRIGSTTYQVEVHMSDKSTETINDKITRLIKRDAEGRAVGE